MTDAEWNLIYAWLQHTHFKKLNRKSLGRLMRKFPTLDVVKVIKEILTYRQNDNGFWRKKKLHRSNSKIVNYLTNYLHRRSKQNAVKTKKDLVADKKMKVEAIHFKVALSGQQKMDKYERIAKEQGVPVCRVIAEELTREAK